MLIALFAWTSRSGEAQEISLGVLTGASLTEDFRSTEYRFGNASRFITDESQWFMVGPKVEVGLPGKFSFEVNAIRRRIRYRDLTELDEPLQFPNGITISSIGPFISDAFTWQFSLFGKYRSSPTRNVTPFFEFGPSFLPIENRDQTGLTAGSGVEIPFGRLRVSPTLRYTRWVNKVNLDSVSDQLQFVVGIHETSTSRRPRALGRPLSLGLVVGSGITRLLKDTSDPTIDPAFQFVSTSDSHTPIAGILIEAPVLNDLLLEVNALYRPTHERSRRVLPDGSIRYGEGSAFLSWQVPVLVKYKAPLSQSVRPLFELGPSFRAISHANSENYSHYGVTGGAGVSLRLRDLTVSPTLRYTRWAADKRRLGREPSPPTRPDQLEFVVGFSF
jgi:hypothetical protein